MANEFEDDVIHDFVEESREHLQDIEAELLQIEEHGAAIDGDLVNKVFRGIHSIKGVAGFLDLHVIRDLAHALENVLDLIRKQELVPTTDVVDTMLTAADELSQLVEGVQSSNERDVTPQIEALRGVVASDSPGTAPPASNPTAMANPDGSEAVATSNPTAPTVYSAKARPGPLAALASDPESVFEEVGKLLEGSAALLECWDAQSTDSGRVIPVVFASKMSPEELMDHFGGGIEDIIEQEAEAATTTAAATPAAVASSPPNTAKAPTQPSGSKDAVPAKAKNAASSIRVPVQLLDELMNLAGELVLGRNQLMKTVASQSYDDLERISSRLDQVTSDLQVSVMQTRMQPIGNIFSRFPRVVRDLAGKLGKECELEIEGKEVDLDKTLIEAIGDPLTHLVRNAVDHGLESPAERAKAGKPATGRVFLRAFHQGGKVNISISDDGRGIDPDIIKSSAIRKGQLTEEEAAAMSDRDALELIFRPGLSTATVVSDVSGRGVGMDVVRTNLESLGGTVEIESSIGHGTTITVKIPLTLAILAAMVVTVDSLRFAIPQANVRELVRVRAADRTDRIRNIQGREMLRLRDQLVPMVHLREILCRRGDAPKSEVDANTAMNIIIVESGSFLYGLAVDPGLDAEEIVVKALGRHQKSRTEYAGATILGSGEVAMILDINGIASVMELKAAELLHGEEEPESERGTWDVESVVLFRYHETEHFAVPVSLVQRIERIRRDQIDLVGASEVYETRDRALPLLRLPNAVTARPLDEDPETFSILVTTAGEQEVGILVPLLGDIRDMELRLDSRTLVEPGVMGSFQQEGTATRMLDLSDIMSRMFPQWVQAGIGRTPKQRPQTQQGSGEAALTEDGVGLPPGEPSILLAEDSDFFRDHLVGFLQQNGIQVTAASDGAEAWKILDGNPTAFLAVVTDVEMPEMDGLELARRIRADERFTGIPIMAVTSLASDEDRRRGKEAGIDEYQVKLDKQRLLITLNSMIGLVA